MENKFNFIFLVGGLDALKNRISNNLYCFLSHIANNSKYKDHISIMSSDDSDSFNKIVELSKNKKIIVCSVCSYHIFDDYQNIISILDIEDSSCFCRYECKAENESCKFHGISKFADDHCKYAFVRYDTYLTRFNLHKTEKLIFPHFIDNNIFQDRKIEKKYDILLYGNCIRQTYPFRNRLLVLFRKNPRNLNVKIVEFSKRRRYKNKLIHGKELSELINSSWITISTKSLNNFLLQRYMEVSMSGSVICGDYPDLLMNDGFDKSNMVLINMEMTDDEILDKIELYLSDKRKLKEMSINSKTYFSDKYNYQRGVNLFDQYYERIVKNETVS